MLNCGTMPMACQPDITAKSVLKIIIHIERIGIMTTQMQVSCSMMIIENTEVQSSKNYN